MKEPRAVAARGEGKTTNKSDTLLSSVFPASPQAKTVTEFFGTMPPTAHRQASVQ
jgi:hypothetical protein